MLSFIIFCLFICAIYNLLKGKPKDKKDVVKDNQAISQLPYICLQGKKLSTGMKILNLCDSGDLIDNFCYDPSDRSISIKMQNGDSVHGPINSLTASFSSKNGLNLCRVKNTNGREVIFPFKRDCFTDKEWDIVLSTLTLCGTTYGKNILGSTYQFLSGAKSVMKVVKLLGKM